MMANRTKTFGIAAATGTIAAGALLAGAGAAQANPSDTNTCQPGQVMAYAEEVPSDSTQHANYVVSFKTTEPGTQCLLTGTPKDLTFHDASGAELPVDSYSTGSENTQVLIDSTHPAQVEVQAPNPQEQGEPATTASFTMSNSTDGVPFSIAWKADLNGPVEIGSLTGGVVS
ncbi:hypothetical protein [Prauserella cavernicola]|uniref:DUF4232 domain-containing protein n=1 Tax=Prauserella cavernicola TaxID=2800127 RepID=A0A934QR99_9PSEU|nr:hypothetical protein [Prauserella cavernicola]MBK1784234.1 hypothetical protein [Prauserella cavernicola]